MSQRLKKFLDDVDFDVQCSIHNAGFTERLVLVLKGRKECKNERLKRVGL